MENTFGEFLKLKRQEKGLTQKDLAKLLFLSESAVSKWEKNVAHPDIYLLPKLADILGVTERELITASIDDKTREEQKYAKKWRVFAFAWDIFFYLAYGISILTCFICNLAVNKNLSWFWILFSALILSFTITNLPKFIKKLKLIFIPLSIYLALCLLLILCCIYTGGNWLSIPILSIFFLLVAIFLPIYIAKYNFFSKVKKYNDYISIGVCFILLNILLILINLFTFNNGFSSINWYLKIALPISFGIFIIINILLSVRFIKTNKALKTSIVLFIINLFIFAIPIFIKVDNPSIQKEIDQLNIFNARLGHWIPNFTLEANIILIICLTLLLISMIFLIYGLLKHLRKNSKT